jgi:predicted DNA-binding transcriptional regulator YafY
MARTTRLLDLIQMLRSHRAAVSASYLAEALAVSHRTIYRDIQALIALGVPIEGQAGVGYVLRPGFILPPLMFSGEQIEAIVLGARMVSQSGDGPLAYAARQAMVKIAAVLPGDGRDTVAAIGLLSGPRLPTFPDGVELAHVRAAIRSERRIAINYRDEGGQLTNRWIWPVALTIGIQVRLLATWCELRHDFRSFALIELSQLRRRVDATREAGSSC